MQAVCGFRGLGVWGLGFRVVSAWVSVASLWKAVASVSTFRSLMSTPDHLDSSQSIPKIL